MNDHSSEPSRPKEGSKDGEIDFRKIVEIANVGIVIAKPEGAYIFVNNKLAEMLGYSISEILGKSATDFANGEDSKEKVLQARRDVRKNKFASGELKFRRKDGSVLWAHYNSSAISNSNGKHIANVAMLTDITERKHAEEEILSLSRFPSENPNAVYRINKEGLVLYANPASQKLPRPLNMKTGQEAPDIWRHRASEAVATNKSLDIEETIDHQAYLFKIEPAPSEGYVNVYGTDVTERKRIENQLREVERFASIGRTAAMIGHDLRNPLQGIVGTISLLTERVAQMKCTREERQRLAESLEEINQLTFYMDKIVSDLQDYARPVKPNPAKFDLSRLVQGAILSCRIPDKVSVDVRIPKNQTTVTLDAAIIRRVLTNLINNSVQAMPEGGKLTITASQKKKPHSITITVEDTGIGISREDKRKIFTPLFTTKSKGQGLGLPVCKRLVEAMNGTINFESEKGKGTKFTIQLP